MLGFDALGRLALGQAGSSSATTTSLLAANGSFVLSGQAAVFQVLEASAFGSYVLNGQAVTCQGLQSAACGAFTLLGQTATFQDNLAAACAAFALGGQATIDLDTEVAATGLFALMGEPSLWSYDLLGGGGEIIGHHAGDAIRSGTPFTKRRFRDLRDALRAERDAERAAEQERVFLAREVAAAEARAMRAAIEAARDAEDRDNEVRARLRLLSGASRAEAGARGVSDTLAASWALAHAARHAGAQAARLRDDEEALLLLAA